MKYIVKNCPAVYIFKNGYSCNNLEFDEHIYCKDIPDCIIKQIIGLCKDVKGKDPIVAERDKQTGEIISIGGWNENPVYDFAQKILNLLEIEEVNEE
jgi:hypothetical protein